MTRLALGLAALAAILVQAPDAQACFDGFSVASDQVTATIWTDGEFDLQEARTMARWTTRLDALLPEGATLHMENVFDVRLCGVGDECQLLEVMGGDEQVPSLELVMARTFGLAAKASGATPRETARARSRQAVLYEVQIGSFASAALADTMVASINEKAQLGQLPWEQHSFYSAGGYPALHDPVARHTAEVNGHTMHRVIAGVFLDADEARAHRARLAEAGFASAIHVEKL
ncbi:MAG: SPOR domain-containing protein [Myxococcales bacterium]|nr:SPOR domain-containing protein [Myxococcales bacterium]